jgi:excinuclease ABC subunit B
VAQRQAKNRFQLVSEFQPAGDQPSAIASMVENIEEGLQHQTLLGVTGSGKTFSMAQVINETNLPALVLAPNKTLAAQLFTEFKELFPKNAVEYFVSYYDYYQPEAYVPASDTFIEKDSAINEQIDRMRHSATRSLFDRRDVLIVSSVSCIYGLGSPEAYEGMMIHLHSNTELRRDHFMRELIRIQYKRSDVDFSRGSFRVRGDIVEIMPPYEEDRALRVEFLATLLKRSAGLTRCEVKFLMSLIKWRSILALIMSTLMIKTKLQLKPFAMNCESASAIMSARSCSEKKSVLSSELFMT